MKRSVAIKVLPEAVASDGERLARFRREAEVLAALNHPNIAAIYGLEESQGAIALVVELVDGPALTDRIAQGAMPVDEVLPIAKQIAEALEAAHEQGFVHRDLKPANIKVRADGTVKVLDFGLAKAMEPAAAPGASAGQAHASIACARIPVSGSRTCLPLAWKSTTRSRAAAWSVARTTRARAAPLQGTEGAFNPFFSPDGAAGDAAHHER